MVHSFRTVLRVLALGLGLAASGWAQAQAPGNPLAPGIAPYTPKMLPAPPGRPAVPAAPDGGGAAPASEPVRMPGYDYVLGSGDKLRITVFEEDDLSGEFSVAGNGRISFPLIGDISAAGRTVQQVRDTIAARLRDGYVKDPRVNAEVLTFRPFFILGEVAKPGEYPYMDSMTVMNAIATAGGFTYRANHSVVFIKGVHALTEQKVRLRGDLLLSPGDIVRIGARLF